MNEAAGRHRLTNKKLWLRTAAVMIAGFMAIASASESASAQTSTGSAVAVKTPAFEVVSIRQSQPGADQNTSITPNEFVLTGATLEYVIKFAYYPQLRWYWPKQKELSGAPPWVGNEKYDIIAKIDRTTAEEWKNLTERQLIDKMKPLLQAMLVERCKLVLHTTTEEGPIWALVVRKHGPKLKKADPNKALPSHAFPLTAGGGMVSVGRGETQTLTVSGAPMASLAQILTLEGASRLVYDRTGLTGRYDFVLSKREAASPAESPGDLPLDPAPATTWDVEALGLTLKPAKAPTQILVIDHIERPSEN